jgi:hypothetical protein
MVCKTLPQLRAKRPFLDPAVDTPLTKDSGDTAKAPCFSAICRTFRSGGTRIRTGDTMIFSHIRRPLGMRETRMGKRIYVQGVPVGTSWFCPYCCATVDTSTVTLRSTGKGGLSFLHPFAEGGASTPRPSRRSGCYGSRSSRPRRGVTPPRQGSRSSTGNEDRFEQAGIWLEEAIGNAM